MMVAEIKMSFISKVFPLRLRRSNPSTPTQRREIGYPISFFCLLLAREQALVNQFPKIFAIANSSRFEVGGVRIK